MCTQQFTALPNCNKEHWRCMLCMRLSSQTSVVIQSQHQAQSAFHGCCNPTDREGLPSLPPIPDIPSVSGRCQMAQDADNRCHTFETLEIRIAENTRNGNGNKESLLTLPATCKNLQKHPAVPAQHTNRRTSLLDQQDCAPQNHLDMQGSVSSRSLSLCRCNLHSSPRVHTMYLQIDFIYLVGHRNAVQCAPATDVLSHEKVIVCEIFRDMEGDTRVL